MVKSTKKSMLALVAVGLIGATALAMAEAKCSHDTAEQGKAQYQALLKAREENNRLNKRQSPITSLAQQMALTDPQQECSYYNYPLIDTIISHYPQPWEIAYIIAGDDEARNAFNAIMGDPQLPNLPPKGTPQGDFSATQYDAGADPDCWWTMSRCDQPKRQGIPADVNTCAEPMTWGASFDDGPNCTHNEFYNVLQQKEVTATMFYIGSNVINWPYQAQRGLHDGHEISIHSWSHRYMTGLSNEQIFAELWYTRKAIKDVIGVTPTTWRAPFGDVDDRVRFIAHKMGLTTVLWDHDTFDWRVQGASNPNGIPTASVEGNYDAILNNAKQGGFSTHGTIVLTHEINGNTMAIAEDELDDIFENFDHIVPIAVCQNWTHPYIEQEYTFPTFAQWIIDNSTNSSVSATSSTAMSGTVAVGSTASAPTSTGPARTTNGTRSATSATNTSRAIGAHANNNSTTTSSASHGVAPLLVLAVVAFVPALSTILL